VKKNTGVSQPRWAIWCEIWKWNCLPSLILYQSKNCGHRIHVLFLMYDVYWYCQKKKKRMIMKFLKKEWFIWKFWKKGGSRENGGGGNEIHAPCTCDTVLRCTSKDWLARNQVNVYVWSDMSTRWLVSVSKHYKNHTKRVGLVQSWPNFHLIECNLFSPWYS
jgi:hypothetical protein